MAGKLAVRLLAQRSDRVGQCIIRALLAGTLLAGSLSPATAQEVRRFAFAEPNYALLATKNEFARGYLGLAVDFESHKTTDGRSFGALRIQRFTTGSPLPGVGVQIGDAIVAVNGYMFSTGQKMIDFINTGSPGAYVKIEISTAGGHWRTVNVPLIARAGSVPTVSLERPLSIPERSVPDRSDAQMPRSTNSEGWVGTAIVIGTAAVVGCAIFGCFGSDDEASESAGNGSDYRRPDSSRSNDRGYEAEPDTSIGCAWGDQKYGTCH